MKRKILFVCVHNSARSQNGGELLRKYGGDSFEAESAGIEPGRLNPVVVELLNEKEGIDISGKETKGVDALLKKGVCYDHVITVCDESQSENALSFRRRKEGRTGALKTPHRSMAAGGGQGEDAASNGKNKGGRQKAYTGGAASWNQR
jgi:arsenate reductase